MSEPIAALPLARSPEEVGERLGGPRVPVSEAVAQRLAGVCASVTSDAAARLAAGRDWWPLAARWAAAGDVPAAPAVVAHPASASEVAAVLRICQEVKVPVTPMAGRSGVCGGSVPVFGGVALDLCAMAGVTELDETSLLADVLPGTFGPDLEAALEAAGTTLGHWPQSMAISTVGGWVACRGAGQYSTCYGKIEDMVVGLEVALPDGRLITTGGRAPRSATGPDLTQLFVGAEGTLGVITSARLRLRARPPAEGRATYRFPSFSAGLEGCRSALRAGATPAVLRLYDEVESARSFAVDGGHVAIVLDEAEEPLVAATLGLVDRSFRAAGAEPLAEELVDRWLTHRNDVSILAPLVQGGVVVDTIEVAARWRALPELYRRAVAAVGSLEGTLAASAHQSHAYPDGACLYFTFAGRRPGGEEAAPGDAEADGWAEGYYVAAWTAVMAAVEDAGGAISHHHGIGLNRGRFLRSAMGEAHDVLAGLKAALDPAGICNPGKLGLASPYGEVPWP